MLGEAYGHTRGFSLVELMIVVAIVGLLAAIAVPAFLKYVRQSKTSEAEMIMSKMATGARAYFQSTQKGCAGSSNCSEPWHGSTASGSPIKWDDYVFPGGSTSFDTKGGNPPPKRGSKYEIQLNASKYQDAIVNKLNFDTNKTHLYFKYVYTPSGAGADAEAIIEGIADFKPTNSNDHTYTQTVSVDSEGQLSISPVTLRHEYE